MPYLTETDFNAPSGELNRAFTKILLDRNINLREALTSVITKYVHDQKARYATFNDVIGALECAKMEYTRRTGSINSFIEDVVQSLKFDFYRDTVAPYEDKKIAEHGDIYAQV